MGREAEVFFEEKGMTRLSLLFLLVVSAWALALFAIADTSNDQDLLKAICDDPSQIIKRGCSVCPSFTGLHGKPEKFELQDTYSGAFSAPRVKETLLSFHGCEDPAAGQGGIALLQSAPPSWRRISYRASTPLAQCVPFQNLARTTELICKIGDRHFGDKTIRFEQFAFSGSEHYSVQALLKEVRFDSNAEGGDVTPGGYCYEIIPSSWNLTTHEPWQLSIQGRGKKLAVEKTDLCDLDELPQQLAFEIVLNYDGKTFVPARESVKVIDVIRKFRQSLKTSRS
jgi:hypothetical protein